MKKIIFLLFLFSGCAHFSATWQDDIFSHTDYGFTNEADLSLSYKPQELNPDIREVSNLVPQFRVKNTDPTKITRYRYTLAQTMYTPHDLAVKDIQYNDNPYAGTLTLDTTKISAQTDVRIETTVRLGVSGPWSGAELAQKTVHDTLTNLGDHNTHPSGWDNQISTAPLFNLNYERDFQDTRFTNTYYEAVTDTSEILRLGNIETNIEVSKGFKLGNRVPTLAREDSEPFSFYFLSNIFGIAQIHNLYYQGNMVNDSPYTTGIQYFVGGIQNGFQLNYKTMSGKFIYQTETARFSEENQGLHSFGGIILGAEF